MIVRIRRLLSFSNVIACLALFVALGGSVYAAGKISGKQIKRSSLPGNRIKPKTIQPNRIKPKSLTGRQIKADSLTGRQIKAGSLTGRQIKVDSLTGAQIDEKSLTGITAGALAGVEYQATSVTLPGNGSLGRATANCPPGTYVVGGGATLSNDNGASVNSSGPSPLYTGWRATAYSWFGPGQTLTVTAICVLVERPRGAANSVRYEPAG